MKTLSLILTLALLSSCATQTVYLHQLRDGGAGSKPAHVYSELEKAVELANGFLNNSSFAKGFPAEGAQFELGVNNILLRLENEYDLTVAIETTYWGDWRFMFGSGVQSSANGLIAAHRPDGERTDDITDNEFLQLDASNMAAILLRQSAIMREIRARGEIDYWLNYKLLGIDPARGWGEDSHVNKRGVLTEQAFRLWLTEQAE
jgi:hypothetical protein